MFNFSFPYREIKNNRLVHLFVEEVHRRGVYIGGAFLLLDTVGLVNVPKYMIKRLNPSFNLLQQISTTSTISIGALIQNVNRRPMCYQNVSFCWYFLPVLQYIGTSFGIKSSIKKPGCPRATVKVIAHDFDTFVFEVGAVG